MKGFFEDLQKFSLPRVAFLETFFKKTEKLDIADKAPRGFIDKAWRNFADEALDEKITSSRLVSMYNAGLVDRVKDKAYFGDDRFHYFPTTTPDNSWN